uniref:phosphoribosylanthranilate isomerase n=1 Tax=Olsenella uli TaxID=133926 RepID=UPI0028E23F8F|nr:phosphoribosylanthranilate isomerase [Olsenella uli]
MLGRRITTIITHDVLYSNSAYTRVKLCGMFREEDIEAVNVAAPDLCGFVVNRPKSHRHVDRDRLWALVSRLDPSIPAVGVFVDQPLGYVSELADEVLDVVQLHGTEENPYITFLRELVDIPIIQAIELRTREDVERANESKADFVLLDIGRDANGRPDQSLLPGLCRPFVLSGGLTPDGVARDIAEVAPWGVDMSSGLETDGLKDPEKIRAAVAAVRGATPRQT